MLPALAFEVPPEQGDQLGHMAATIARLADAVTILELRIASNTNPKQEKQTVNELAKTTNQNYVARYEGGDPYAQFANEGGAGIIGKFLRCRKGEWTIGADDDPVKPGTQYLALVPTSMRGWKRWQGGIVVDAHMGLIADDYLVPHRHTLGDLDEGAWEPGQDGKPRDPWSRCYQLLLIEMARPHGDVTFSGSSYGAERALKELCGTYSDRPSPIPRRTYPVVALGGRTRPPKIRQNPRAGVRGDGLGHRRGR